MHVIKKWKWEIKCEAIITAWSVQKIIHLVKEDKVNSLKTNLLHQQVSFQRITKVSDCVTKASLQVSWVTAKKQKSLYDDMTVVWQQSR